MLHPSAFQHPYHLCHFLNLLCSKYPIPGIAQSRTDISILIETAVQVTHINLNIRMGLVKTFKSFRGSDDCQI